MKHKRQEYEIENYQIDISGWIDDQQELKELRAEVSRHHNDFERIRKILDQADHSYLNTDAWTYEQRFEYLTNCLKAIRNIVG